MLAKTFSAMMVGLEALKIEVEVDGNRGTPNLIFIGLTSKATEEAKERMTVALQNCGVRLRSKRTVVNLAPADVPKSGSSFDLAIAVGLLKMYGEVQAETDDTLFFGELSLDGRLKKIRGALPLVIAARKLGFQKVIIPAENQNEVRVIDQVQIFPLRHLSEYIEATKKRVSLPRLTPIPFVAVPQRPDQNLITAVKGQERAKRAILIAAAGAHNLLLCGPPGSGKSMLAQSMTTLLPTLTKKEALEVSALYSLNGMLTNGLCTTRPFRSLHHTISATALLGGGAKLKPGEVTLAHRGVLFMDEFLEFPPHILETLRQPLETKSIYISRQSGSVTFPAAFTLIAATNPCPCGYKGSLIKNCRCAPSRIEKYQQRLSGPLLDRFDLKVLIKEVAVEDLTDKDVPYDDANFSTLQQQVAFSRQKQITRYQHEAFFTNADIPAADIGKWCVFTKDAQKLFRYESIKRKVTGRSYFKMTKVSRTIADLDNSEVIQEAHVREAFEYQLDTIGLTLELV